MQYLKQSTEVKVVIGPFVDVSDGLTPETGITLGAADEAELMKHNAASNGVTDISGATWAAITGMDGYYVLTLTTSLTDTLGNITVAVQDDSVCLPVRADFMVMPANVWDSMFGADKLQVHADEITNGLITAAAIADAAIDNATFAADIGSTAYASNIIALAVRKVLDELNLDHLLKVAVASNADMTTEIIDSTIISNILTATGDTSDYAYATDSLEALGTGVNDTGVKLHSDYLV